jgi:hypothetical protein
MSEDMVQIWVPRKHVVAVYGYIASLEQGEGGGEVPVGAPPDGPTPNGPDDNEEWSPKVLRRMYDESPPAMVRILDYLAENPDREVPSEEITEAIEPGSSSNRLAGTLGAFGRRVGNRYGMESWPFDRYWSYDHDSMVYWMDGWVADKIRSYKAA